MFWEWKEKRMYPKFAFMPYVCAACGGTSWFEMGWEKSLGVDMGKVWNCKQCGPDAEPWSNHRGQQDAIKAMRRK